MDYTVEVAFGSVATGTDEAFDRLREVLDVVPGTVLLESPEAPVLLFAVESETPLGAAKFVDGVCTVMELRPVRGRVFPTPELDVDLGDDLAPEEAAAHRWEPEATDGARLVSR